MRVVSSKDSITGYAWRRGVAYILDKNATEESRKFIIGHKSDSKIFSSYMSRVTDVDLQALFRGEEQHDLKRMMSISLNRKDDAPTRISDTGYTDILTDPALVALEIEFSAIQAVLCSELVLLLPHQERMTLGSRNIDLSLINVETSRLPLSKRSSKKNIWPFSRRQDETAEDLRRNVHLICQIIAEISFAFQTSSSCSFC